MNQSDTRHRLAEIARFGLVGGLATVTHFVIATAIFRAVPGSLFVANAIGFGVAFFVSYFGHYHLTFRANTAHGASVPKFALVALIGFLINTAVLWVFTQAIGYQSLFGLAFSIVLAAGCVYLLSRTWAFAR